MKCDSFTEAIIKGSDYAKDNCLTQSIVIDMYVREFLANQFMLSFAKCNDGCLEEFKELAKRVGLLGTSEKDEIL